MNSTSYNQPSFKPKQPEPQKTFEEPIYPANVFEDQTTAYKKFGEDIDADFRRHVESLRRVARAYQTMLPAQDNIVNDIIFNLDKWADRYDNGPKQDAAGISNN